DIKAAAVGAQNAGRMHPGIGFTLDTEIGVDSALDVTLTRLPEAEAPPAHQVWVCMVPVDYYRHGEKLLFNPHPNFIAAEPGARKL
ncbi:MAG: hypothetical protein ACRD2G_12980, partial [Terriglobia bacterium]